MEELNVSATAVMVHLLITCIPWLIGIAVGGGLGVLCGLGIRALFSRSPAWRRVSVLLPWRTFVTGLLMAVWSPLFVTILGLGPIAGGVMVAASISILVAAFAVTTLLEYWYPSPLASRLVAGTRTLAVASGMIAAGMGLLGGGGVGYIILEAARLSQYGVMWKGLLVVLALALVLDLMLGLAQMIAFRHSGEGDKLAGAERMAA
jgi:ABC-type nitrate/sulfonate/bicarbonate transport system permease component